jgi:hypothetical protein
VFEELAKAPNNATIWKSSSLALSWCPVLYLCSKQEMMEEEEEKEKGRGERAFCTPLSNRYILGQGPSQGRFLEHQARISPAGESLLLGLTHRWEGRVGPCFLTMLLIPQL